LLEIDLELVIGEDKLATRKIRKSAVTEEFVETKSAQAYSDASPLSKCGIKKFV
jgi:hypothetical protein